MYSARFKADTADASRGKDPTAALCTKLYTETYPIFSIPYFIIGYSPVGEGDAP
jgi:hypothetical protein